MTVKLLSDWGPQPAGTLFTGTAATETAMVGAGVATTSLAGGVAWVPNMGSSSDSARMYLGRKTAAYIAALNASLTAGTASYPAGTTVTLSNPGQADDGKLYTLVGTQFAVDGGGSIGPFVPGAPTIGTATAGNASVTVPFTAPASPGASTIIDYQAMLIDGTTKTITVSPAVFAAMTNGAAYVGAVRARNTQGYGPWSAQSNSVTPTAEVRTGVLRAISPWNRTNSVYVTSPAGYNQRVAFRQSHWIGSGDADGLRIVLNNWAIGTTTIFQPGNTNTFSNLYLESVNTGASIGPLTISSSNSLVMTNGQSDVQGDLILPSSFGLSKFTVGEQYFIRGLADTPASGNLPARPQVGLDSSDTVAFAYDPGATTCTNISGTGALTFTGTAATSCAVPQIMLVGTFISGDPFTINGLGDSIMAEAIDTTGNAAKVGVGFLSRALYNNGVGILGGINTALDGCKNDVWINGASRLQAMAKYCNRTVYEMGGNSFQNTAANDATNLANTIANDRTIYAALKSGASVVAGTKAHKIIRTLLLPHTTGSWGSNTTQTVYGPKWDAGGDVNSYNDTCVSDVGVTNRTDYLYDSRPITRWDASNSSLADFQKWALTAGAPSTTEGVHPVPALHASMGAGLRAVINAAV